MAVTLDRKTYLERRYRRVQSLVNRREQSLVADLLGRVEPRPARILDIPSGHGRFTPLLRRAATAELVCSDLWQRHLDALAAAEPAEGTPIVLRQADLFGRLPFEDRAFDLVFDFRFFQHVHGDAERRHAAAELVRVARRHLIVSFYRTPSVHRVQQSMRRLLRGRKYKVSFQPPAEFRRLFADLGCTILSESGVVPVLHAQTVLWMERKPA
jgi:SAM-dependent methyltransferase